MSLSLRNLNLRHRIKSAPYQILERFLCRGADLRALQERRNFIHRLRVALDDRMRWLEGAAKPEFQRTADGVTQALPVSIMRTDAPWRAVPPPRHDVPGMITDEESQYYVWLGSHFLGLGEVVELGPWLGKSTLSIVEGLVKSGRFAGRKLNVYEDFVWRSSFMNNYVPPSKHRRDGENFLPLFEEMTTARQEWIRAEARAIQRQSWNAHLPLLEWSGGPVEMMFIDCGKAFLENEAWFRVFSAAFIPNVTLLVMQDWRSHRKVPRQRYAHTWQFTESKAGAFELVHETLDGDVATFLWRGEVDVHRAV